MYLESSLNLWHYSHCERSIQYETLCMTSDRYKWNVFSIMIIHCSDFSPFSWRGHINATEFTCRQIQRKCKRNGGSPQHLRSGKNTTSLVCIGISTKSLHTGTFITAERETCWMFCQRNGKLSTVKLTPNSI